MVGDVDGRPIDRRRFPGGGGGQQWLTRMMYCQVQAVWWVVWWGWAVSV